MIRLPTVDEVVEALTPFGVQRTTLTSHLVGPRGLTVVTCLERDLDGGVRLSQPLPTDTTNMSWDTFDRLCRQLGIDPDEVDLGFPRPPRWWLHPGVTH